MQTGLAAVRRRAEASGLAVVDLSIGAPVDPTPDVVRRALAAASDAPGYPLTSGRRELRASYAGWLARVHGVTALDPDAGLPVVGTKELIGSLAVHLGLGAGATVALPRLAYPTYAVGAALAGARTVVADTVDDLDPGDPPALWWVNSPSNPTGRVLPPAELARAVAWAREHGTLLVSDECYLDLGWDTTPVSVLHDDVSGGRHDGLLAVHSLSKRSNLAGYRIGFVGGDPALVAELLAVRRNLGLQLPDPQQAVALAALDDDEHVAAQRARYAARRRTLLAACAQAGLDVDHSEAGLYVWATAGESSEVTVGRLADLGLVVVDGREYGAAGAQHVRLSLTASDHDVALAAERLAGSARLGS